MSNQQLDIFGDSAINQQNPLTARRVGFIGTFKNRAALVKKVKEFGEIPTNVEFVPIDFEKESIANALARSGFNILRISWSIQTKAVNTAVVILEHYY